MRDNTAQPMPDGTPMAGIQQPAAHRGQDVGDPSVPPEAHHAAAAEPQARDRNGGSFRRTAIAVLTAAVVAAGVAAPVAWLTAPVPPQTAASTADVPTTAEPVLAADGASNVAPASVAEVAAAASPSVAFVEVTAPAGQAGGSAVIIDADGYLLTNAHVVEGAGDITVTLADGSSHTAALVGADLTSDTAVLRIDATGLPTLEVGAEVEVGEPVVAIGSPFGLEGSVTFGIVSGVDRTLSGGPGQPPLIGMIQTDAAINPGNSGGALVDTQGRLLGINTAIYSATGTSSGVGFATPAATAVAVAEQLIETGSVTYPQLGIHGVDVTPRLAAAYGLPVDSGVLVAAVVAGSAADDAGVDEGDVIVSIDDEPVTSMTALSGLIRARAPGDVVRVGIDRDGGELDLSVTLGAATS